MRYAKFFLLLLAALTLTALSGCAKSVDIIELTPVPETYAPTTPVPAATATAPLTADTAAPVLTATPAAATPAPTAASTQKPAATQKPSAAPTATATASPTATPTAAGMQAQTASPTSDVPSSDSEGAERVLELVNYYREKNGLAALSSNSSLVKAANVRAKEISSVFDHVRPDGSNALTVSSSARAENIAQGTSNFTADSIMEALMNSQVHRTNILNSAYTIIGVGVYQSGDTVYWVQLFG